MRPFFLAGGFSERSPVFWWLSPGEGGTPLHDAVGIKCKMDATTEYQDADVKYMSCWWLCVCYLIWHEYSSLVEGESRGILLLYLFNKNVYRNLLSVFFNW